MKEAGEDKKVDQFLEICVWETLYFLSFILGQWRDFRIGVGLM